MTLFWQHKKSLRSKDNILPIFARQAALAVQASSSLYEMSKTCDRDAWKRLEKEVKVCEIQGDAILEEFYEELYDNIIPHGERSDLQILAMMMDDFIDGINTSAKSLMLYLPTKMDHQLSDLAQYIEAEADAMKKIIPLLNDVKGNTKNIFLQCDRITELEHAADEAYEEYIGEIFAVGSDAIEIIKEKNIAEALEAATDTGKRFSDHIRKMMIRYI